MHNTHCTLISEYVANLSCVENVVAISAYIGGPTSHKYNDYKVLQLPVEYHGRLYGNFVKGRRTVNSYLRVT